MTGRRGECLDQIDRIWTDMRPLGLREHVEDTGGTRSAGHRVDNDVPGPPEGIGADPALVERLSSGRHPVEAVFRPDDTADVLEECLELQYLRIRFPRTAGVTELGLRLERAAGGVVSRAVESGKGTVHVEATLTLDRHRVRCVVDLDVTTLRGEGHLAPMALQLEGP